jgi:hypothetical protein
MQAGISSGEQLSVKSLVLLTHGPPLLALPQRHSNLYLPDAFSALYQIGSSLEKRQSALYMKQGALALLNDMRGA